MNRPCPEAAREHGLTLTEMLVVIAIIALTLTLSLPYAQTSGTARRLDAAADTLAALLRDTRSRAIAVNAPQLLSLDLDSRTVTRAGAKPLYTLPDSIGVSLTTAGDLVAEHQGGITFFADGGASGGMMELRDGELTRRIAVNWLTGAIVISDATEP
jgi:general secretion pathway protein H